MFTVPHLAPPVHLDFADSGPAAPPRHIPTIHADPSIDVIADRLAWLHDGGDLDDYPGFGWATPRSFDLSSLPPFVAVGSLPGSEEAPRPAVVEGDAWDLGHSHALAGLPARIPADFTVDDFGSYRDGWLAGDAERRNGSAPVVPSEDTSGTSMMLVRDERGRHEAGPVVPPADEMSAFLAELHGADHDQQPDPNAIECWAMPNEDWYDAEAMFDDVDPDVEFEWSERARVMGHRVAC